MSALVKVPDYLASSSGETDQLPPLFSSTHAPGLTAGEYADVLTSWSATGSRNIAIHIRLPFCPSRCLSCDHHTTVTHNGDAIDDYLNCLEREITMVTDRIGRHLPLTQLHLGGGTPNYLSDTQLSRLMDIIDSHFGVSSETETSLEANPKRCSPTQLALLKGLGFGIINFQVRDIDSAVQLAVGRSHSLPMLKDVMSSARGEGFETIGMDLVYGLPNQTLGSIQETVGRMLELAPERIVCHSFSRRPDIFKHQRAIDTSSLPSLADKVAMFNSACESMLDNDYDWVGLDCFAHRDDPLAIARLEGNLHRNWVGYTAHHVGDLFGFGADAISQISTANVQNQVQLDAWRESIQAGQLPLRSGMLVCDAERRRRQAMNDLMCNLELSDYRDLLDTTGETNTLAELARDGLVQVTSEKIEVTAYGRFALHQLWGDASPHFRGLGVL